MTVKKTFEARLFLCDLEPIWFQNQIGFKTIIFGFKTVAEARNYLLKISQIVRENFKSEEITFSSHISMQPVNFNNRHYFSFDVHLMNVINLPNPVSCNFNLQDPKVDFEDDKKLRKPFKKNISKFKISVQSILIFV